MRKMATDKKKTAYPWMEEYRPEFKRNRFKIRSQEGFILILIFLPFIILGLIGFIEPKLYSITSLIFNIYFLTLLLYIFCGVFIPMVWILIKISLRTRNKNFVYQSVFYIQYAIFELFLLTYRLRPINERFTILDSMFDVYYYLTNLLSIPDEIAAPLPIYAMIGYLGLFILIWSSIKQPLFLDNFNSMAYQDSSTILSSQALEISSEEDGYSQRNLFLEFEVLSKIIPQSEDFHSFGINYSKFLGKKGVIIDWEITDTSIKLYPRFLMYWPRLLKEPLRMIRVLNNVRKRHNLTVIEIIFNSPQISIHVSPSDYDILAREVTFHLLSLKVLERVKQSILAFLDKNEIVSYDVLFQNT